MKNFFFSISIALFLSSCSYLTVKDKNKKEEVQLDSVSIEQNAKAYIANIAALQYIDYATVVNDTAFLALPSRSAREHTQDNTAAIFLSDMRKSGKFTNICCCKVINSNSENFVWNDSIIAGQTIGFAQVEN